MTLGEDTAILTLLMSPGAGPMAVHRALGTANAMGCELANLFDMPAATLEQRVPEHTGRPVQKILACDESKRVRATKLMEAVQAAGGCTVLTDSDYYPFALRETLSASMPPLLFCAGNIGLLMEPGAAIVGTRTATDPGLALSKRCGEVFAEAGITVISGGAAGVDTAAHEGTLRAGGNTIVVLPQGLLTYQPTDIIREGLSERRVCLVSEFIPDMPWQTQAAVIRNATISAMSRLVCVIEPKKTGGSIRTAKCAIQNGRRVLIYLTNPNDPVIKQLSRTHTFNILDDNRRFHEERLVAFWRSAPPIVRKQPELL